MTRHLPRLKKRTEFLQAHSRGRKLVASGLLLQARKRQASTEPNETPLTNSVASPETASKSDSARFGFTASKKVGNAVQRNLAKRRLRSLAHERLRPHAKPGWDYVLIARPQTLTRSYEQLESDLAHLLKQLANPSKHAGKHTSKHPGKYTSKQNANKRPNKHSARTSNHKTAKGDKSHDPRSQ